jgi:hypothetical protein
MVYAHLPLPFPPSIGDGIMYPTRSQLQPEQHIRQSFYNSIGQSDTVSVPIDSQQHSSDRSANEVPIIV